MGAMLRTNCSSTRIMPFTSALTTSPVSRLAENQFGTEGASPSCGSVRWMAGGSTHAAFSTAAYRRTEASTAKASSDRDSDAAFEPGNRVSKRDLTTSEGRHKKAHVKEVDPCVCSPWLSSCW